MTTAGFRETEHTADWELEVWAPDFGQLLEQAARGMYSLSGAELHTTLCEDRSFEIQALDPESLLVEFLSELLYYSEMEGLGFDHYELKIEGNDLRARLVGAPLESLEKEIKAVTYHNLAIRRTDRGLMAKIVFDV
jgi:SHS2 domain-containing protein